MSASARALTFSIQECGKIIINNLKRKFNVSITVTSHFLIKRERERENDASKKKFRFLGIKRPSQKGFLKKNQRQINLSSIYIFKKAR